MRGRPIRAGDVVLFRLYNCPNNKSYGNIRRGIVTRVEQTLTRNKKIYWVDTPIEYEPYNLVNFWLHRKEIKRVLDK